MKKIVSLSLIAYLSFGLPSVCSHADTQQKNEDQREANTSRKSFENKEKTTNVNDGLKNIQSFSSPIFEQAQSSQQNLLRKIFQSDSLPILKTEGQMTQSKARKPVAVVAGQGRIDLAIYPNNRCVITDSRSLPVKNGTNNIKFLDLITGDPVSVTFRTPKKGHIALDKYYFNMTDIDLISDGNEKSQGDSMRDKIIERAVGHDVFVRKDANSKEWQRMKVLKSVAGVSFCEADDKYEFVEHNELKGISKDVLEVCQNFLEATFTSDSSDDIEIEISYLTPYISQKYAYDIDIFDKLDRVDVAAKYIITNTSSSDIKGANISIKTGTLSENYENMLNVNPQQNEIKFSDVSIVAHGSAICVDHQKKVAHSVSYSVKLAQNDLDRRSSNSQEMQNVSVSNLITLDNMWKSVSRSKVFANSLINVYYRQGDVRNLYGQLKLSDMQKYGDDWKVEVGEANGVSAKYLVVDRNDSVKEQSDYSIKIVLQNDRLEESHVCVSFDIDSEKYKVLKSNIERENDVWNVNLKPNETKELQVRLRVKK